MAVTHRILRPIDGVDHLPAGTLVDASSWKHTAKLVDQRYLQVLTSDEIASHKLNRASKIARAEEAVPPRKVQPAQAPAPAAAKPNTKPTAAAQQAKAEG